LTLLHIIHLHQNSPPYHNPAQPAQSKPTLLYPNLYNILAQPALAKPTLLQTTLISTSLAYCNVFILRPILSVG